MSRQKYLTLLLALTGSFVAVLAPPANAQLVYPPPFPYRNFDPDSAVRVEVTPREAEVYVDGYYAGIVDDFDGVFQRLRLPSGGHDITVYLDGFRAFTQRVYLTPDSTLKIRHKMEPLAAGEIADARPVPANPPQVAVDPERAGPPRRPGGRRAPFPPVGPFPPGGPAQPRPLPPNEPRPDNLPPDQAMTGTLDISVQPADAEVLIDGQPSGGSAQFLVDVSEGEHTIQVRKQGYVGYLTSVRVRRGETQPISITLRKQP
ncbi:MAG: PEGA domain-containing protein [Vicinamibacterales bacterium]